MTDPQAEEGSFAARHPPRDELPSKAQLLRSTVIAAVVACVLLITVVFPAEYGVDPTTIGDRLGLTEMGVLKREMEKTAQAFPPFDPPAGDVAARSDDLTIVLEPDALSEVKLAAARGAHITYRWTSTGPVTHHLHVDQNQGALTYAKGDGIRRDEGSFETAYLGWHGWYFHNPAGHEVTITLHTEGPYLKVGQLE